MQRHTITIYYKNSIDTVDLGTFNKNTVTMGRDPSNDIVIDSPIISSHHALFQFVDDSWVLYDNNSKNGIMVNGKKEKMQRLNNNDILQIDNEKRPLKAAVVIIYTVGAENAGEKWWEYAVHSNDFIYIGRDEQNSIVLNHNTISKKHAVFFHSDGKYYIEDLKSTNGTYLNGTRITSMQPVKMNDVIYIGDTKIIFNGKSLLYNYYSKGFGIDAVSLRRTVTVRNSSVFRKKKKTILSDVSVSINPGELVAIIGTSGAGKTTLLKCLSGLTKPDCGTVMVNGDDFFKNYDVYMNILGYVPQEDAVYDNLTVEELLYYSINLRKSALSKTEIMNQIRQTIKDVELTGMEHTLIKNLSGGQKKRISIAMELLTEPKLLFLDEPTTGLDPQTEFNIAMLLKKLSHDQKTVIFTTHSTSYLDVCDKIIVMGQEGRLCYFGTPKGTLDFFEVKDYAHIYNLIHKNIEYWEDKYKKAHIRHKPLENNKASRHPRHFASIGTMSFQTIVLILRYLKLNLRDKMRLAFLFMQVPLIAFLLGLITEGSKAFKIREEASQIILIVACAAVWVGFLNSVQEISKERGIYNRERNAGLSSIAYIFSKIFVLGLFSLIQSFIFVEVLSWVIELPKPSLLGSVKMELYATIFLTTLVSSVLGLCISSLVKNNDRALGIIPVVLIYQILFSGILFESRKFIQKLSWTAVSHWAVGALGISVNLNDIPFSSPLVLKRNDISYVYSTENLLTHWAVLTLIGVIFTVLTVLALNVNRKRE